MIDRARIQEILEECGVSPDDVEDMEPFEGGMTISYDGPVQPFTAREQETHVIGYDDDRDRYLHVGTVADGRVHACYVIRQSSLVGAFDPDDRYDGCIWIGENPPGAAVMQSMEDLKHTFMFSAIQTWLIYASMMLERIPESAGMPTTISDSLAAFNRRFAGGMGS